MKSNFVSHCIHLGHWREEIKQDITQRRPVGQEAFLAAAAHYEKSEKLSVQVKRTAISQV